MTNNLPERLKAAEGGSELTEEDVLDAFAMEHVVNRDTLVRYIKAHSKHAIALSGLYHDIMVVRLEAEHGQERATFIDELAKAMVKYGWCDVGDAIDFATEELAEFERFEGTTFGHPDYFWDADNWAFNLKDDAIREKHQCP